MARVKVAQTSFTGGELSPRVMGHTDVDRYATGLKGSLNFHPVIQGGLKRRPGTLYTAAAASDTANASILLPFVQGRDRAWMLEFSDLSVRVFNADGTAAGVTMTTPYTSAMLAELDYAQSDATLYLFHPSAPVQRQERIVSTWAFSPINFSQQPFSEVGRVDTPAATLSAATVGTGRTLTAGSAFFLASDVGRAVLAGGGIGVITAYSSTTAVTVTITRAFAGTALAAAAWTMDSSPQTTCTPSAETPVGATITLTLGAAGWRASDVGSIVRLNGGLCRVSSYTSTTVVDAVILVELASNVASPPLAWSLEPPVWSVALGYPRTGTIFQQRLIVAGTTKFPRTVWGSRVGEPLDFQLGTADADAFAFTIDSDESSPIAYVSASKGLAVFTESGEYSMRGGVEKPITPTNVKVEPESGHGCARVRPVSINREIMFVQRSGRKVRGYGYRYDFDGFSSVDITALAEHISKLGVVWMAYQQEPEQLLWCVLADGTMASCTIDRDQQPSVIGWAPHVTDGIVECVACIPSARADQVWLIVRRTINGSTKRYIERMDEFLVPFHASVATPTSPVYGATVDSAVVVDNGSGQTVFSVPHLAGKDVDILADGSQQPRQLVGLAGELTLPRSSKRTVIGLPFESRAVLLTPEFNAGDGSVQGQSHRTGQMVMRFMDTIGGDVMNNEGVAQKIPLRRFGVGVLDQAPMPFTGLVPVTVLGWDKGDNEIGVRQIEPYPMHLLALVRKHTAQG